MSETKQKQLTRKKPAKKKEETDTLVQHSEEKKKKLKELDEFIDGVLQEAGEEFLEEFRQIEGE